MAVERAAFLTTWFDEIWNNGRLDAIEELMVEGWHNWDMLSLMQQVDAIQPAAQLLP